MWQPEPFHNELVSIMDELMMSLEEEIDKCMAVSVSSTQYSTDIDAGETGEIERESKLEVKVQLTCVMKQTITKINQLISKCTAALRSALCQSQSEMKSLKMKLLEMADGKKIPEKTVGRAPHTVEEEEWTEAPLSPEFAEDFEVDILTPSVEAANTTKCKKETTIRARTIEMEQYPGGRRREQKHNPWWQNQTEVRKMPMMTNGRRRMLKLDKPRMTNLFTT
ncbi:hypothetical protein J4Q44_G00378220 [Coregonus suidteri]|uniref:Uncharacterized protein n=1 Tax=Coregonus suidteri TaxID=861788 RepID=A0AAN8KGJ6_9TELE